MPKAHYVLGMAETACGYPEGARTAFFAAARLWPGFADAWVNLGLACYKLGNVPGAMWAMHAARRAVPGHDAATANLAAFRFSAAKAHKGWRNCRNWLPVILAAFGAGSISPMPCCWRVKPPRRCRCLTARTHRPDGGHWRAQPAMAHLQLGQIEPGRAELDAIQDPYDTAILILWRRVFLAVQDGDQATAETLAERIAELADDEAAAALQHRIIAHFELIALLRMGRFSVMS
jgi:hypothetical protein